TAQFKHYLTKQKLSPATLKNYVSDVDRFLSWLGRQLQETTIQPLQLTARGFDDYAAWLNDPVNRINPVSAQRYLASLKRFGSFLFSSKLNDINPAEALKPAKIDPTLDQVLAEFKHELGAQKLSPSTIKNYLSDIKTYLNWARKSIKITDSDPLLR
ncbi:MAG: phage integrase N-terminal SAM-like domain-containing protein, partial [Patescibacteria group bacterium]|nr:phage integrase N-terminal SAM-like domain-containing protein [Patescibacteria group bacterium]